MKMKRIFITWLIVLVGLLSLISPSFSATISISQPGSDSGTVMQGIAFTVTVSGLSGSGTVSLTLPSGFSVEEPLQKSFSSSTSSVSWTTVKANQKLSAQKITATIIVSGTPSSVETDPFDVISPPSLKVSVTPAQITSAGEKTIQVTVQNWGETSAKDVVVKLDLSDTTGVSLVTGYTPSVSLDTILGGSYGSGESKGVSWRVKVGDSASGSILIETSSSNADTVENSILVSVGAAPGSEEVTGGGGGGGAFIPPTPRQNLTENITKMPKIEKRKTLEIIPGKGLINNTKLQSAIEKVLKIAKMDENAIQNLLKLSKAISGNLSASRQFSFAENKSKLRLELKYNGKEKVINFMVYDRVPKSFANSSDEIRVIAPNANISVIEKDPEYLFTYPELNPGDEISIEYEVEGERNSSVIEETYLEVYAEGLEEVQLIEKICTPFERRCHNNTIQECNEEGTGWIDKEYCEYGCNKTTLTCNPAPQTKPNYFWIWVLIGVILAIAIALGVWYFRYRRM